MRHLLPSATECTVFAVMAIFAAIIAILGPAPDIRLAALSMPIFITAGIMGIRRHDRMVRVKEGTRMRIDRPE
jgi:hypothetical protein